jgi:hypothetical protein
VRGSTLLVACVWMMLSFSFAQAHRAGCHRWHSCPSDTDSYICGDRGQDTYCPKPRGSGLQQVPPPGTPATSPASPSLPAAIPVPTFASQRKIRTAQLLLAELGYDPGGPDGTLGPKTRAAIIQFQTQVGMRPDGQVSDGLLIQLSKAKTIRR